ncbi:GntR family transcriptional regulator [Lachnospiraceae bacterium 45-P1]
MTSNFQVNMDEYLPLRDVVFKTLRQAILKGELEPGERLMEIQLAERLGVSRTPIREAIRKLELEGLVLMIPRKGAEVAKISENNLRDVLEVRRSLEELAIDLACQRMTPEELLELTKTEELFSQAIREGDAMRIAQTDERYHEIIYNSTKNDKLVQILNNLREQMYRYRLEYIKDENKRQILLVEHDQIIKALALRHVHEAKIAIREHIDNQEITILKNLKEQENDVQRKISGRRGSV